jgi:hypothetical protein
MLTTTDWCVMAVIAGEAIEKTIVDLALQYPPDTDETIMNIAIYQNEFETAAKINSGRGMAAEFDSYCVFGNTTSFVYETLDGTWKDIYKHD